MTPSRTPDREHLLEKLRYMVSRALCFSRGAARLPYLRQITAIEIELLKEKTV